MPFAAYIVKCVDGSFYTGSTSNLHKRVYQHNYSKSGARYTKQRRPVKLVYFETFETLREAKQREYQIKCLTRKQKLTLVQNFNGQNLQII